MECLDLEVVLRAAIGLRWLSEAHTEPMRYVVAGPRHWPAVDTVMMASVRNSGPRHTETRCDSMEVVGAEEHQVGPASPANECLQRYDAVIDSLAERIRRLEESVLASVAEGVPARVELEEVGVVCRSVVVVEGGPTMGKQSHWARWGHSSNHNVVAMLSDEAA